MLTSWILLLIPRMQWLLLLLRRRLRLLRGRRLQGGDAAQ